MPYHVASSPWTDDRIQALKSLWADKLTASQIAAELGGVSRSSILGKIFRLGLSHSRPKPPKPAPNPKTERRRAKARAPGNERTEALTDLPPDSSPYACTIVSLTDMRCRWPLGEPGRDMEYCGAPKPDDCGPYCGRHAQIAYRPRRAA